MNVLIVGGAGYIGGVTTHLARKARYKVTVVDNLSSGHVYNLPKGVELLQGDITDKSFVRRIFADRAFDCVMHFAAKIQVGESTEKPYEYLQTNTVATLEMIQQAVAHGVTRYIFSSTAAVYGDPLHSPLTEDDPTLPVNPYGTSKFLSEQLLRSYQLTHGLQWCALRYFNVAGAYDGVGPDYPFISHIVPKLLDALRAKQPFTVHGNDYDTPDGTCIRDYVHVADIARAHLLAADKMIGGNLLNQPINLGSNTGFSVKQVINEFIRITGQKLEVNYGPRRAGDPGRLVASNKRAKDLLGWKPEQPLENIIRDHYEWYRVKQPQS
jgi:UDP-glucose 4-epimerase